jgi:predicted nucleic acid-binding protein
VKWLVDTSIWIDHFRKRNDRLVELLLDDAVLVHSAVVGELACGTLRNRKSTLESLAMLPSAPEASALEALAIIERRALHGRGLGWVDVQLLASAVLARANLWTLDLRLARVAVQVSSA